MKNIYLIQPSQVLANETYLPYSVGTLAAYAWQFEDIKSEYRQENFVFLKEPIEELINSMDEPYLAGFSSYMWNIEYNLALAEAIKNKWPGTIITFGGPQVPDDNEYLEKYAFIDILMHGEGEITFLSLLRALSEGRGLSEVNNISFREAGEMIKTPTVLNHDITSFNSPYTAGLFDYIVNDPKYSHLNFNAVLETNRGCPYGCIYCCWAGTESNFRKFSMERVKSDIDWMARNKIIYCMAADSNFGILPRDIEIAEYFASAKKKYGYPVKVETSLAKNKDEATFEIARILESEKMNCGISVAVQSMDPVVLDNIGRRNISIENFANQMKIYRQENIPTYTDFILALPGETYDSFCRGLFCAIEAGQHSSINIHPCEVLPNTILYLDKTRKKYDIKTIVSNLCQDRTKPFSDKRYGTRSEIIISTDTMSTDEWKKAMRFSSFIQAYHSFGIVKFISVYLRRNGISFYDFYMKLFNDAEEKGGYIKSVLDHVCTNIDLFTEGRSNLCFVDKRFCEEYIPFKEGIFLCSVCDTDRLFDEIGALVLPWFSDKEAFEDVMHYQKSAIRLPGEKERTEIFGYDWKKYFEDITDTTQFPPEKKKTVLVRDESRQDNWADYTRDNIWYGKRENKMLHRFEYQQG